MNTAIPAIEALKRVDGYRGRAVVVTSSKVLQEWIQISKRRDLDVDVLDCVDKTVDVGLGITIARPDLKIVVLDSSSTLRTNSNAMITTGNICPRNMIHFLFEDIGRSSTQGLLVPGLDQMDFISQARNSGYRSVYEFEDLETMDLSLESLFKAEGPVFVLIKVFHDSKLLAPLSGDMHTSLRRVRDTLAIV